MAEAKGEMDVQELKGKGDMWSTEQEIGKQKTAMEVEMAKYSAAAAQAGQPKDRGVLGNLFSDERLKNNIITVGKSKKGIPIKEFGYNGLEGRYRGVISKDVPWAISKDNASGYDMVDYSKIDVPFERIK